MKTIKREMIIQTETKGNITEWKMKYSDMNIIEVLGLLELAKNKAIRDFKLNIDLND